MPDSHDPSYVADRLRGGDFTLVDVRGQQEWDAGHVEGAVHLPLDEIEERASELPRDGDLAFICQTGKRSAMAAEQVASDGVRAGSVAGGMDAWTEDGLPVEQGDTEA